MLRTFERRAEPPRSQGYLPMNLGDLLVSEGVIAHLRAKDKKSALLELSPAEPLIVSFCAAATPLPATAALSTWTAARWSSARGKKAGTARPLSPSSLGAW